MKLQEKRKIVGHLWQFCFYSFHMARSHLGEAIRSVEQNPVRAGLVENASHWRWSYAMAHLRGRDMMCVVETERWEREGRHCGWPDELACAADATEFERFCCCTDTGRPFGDKVFTKSLAAIAGVSPQPGNPGRPKQTGRKRCLSPFRVAVGAGEVQQRGAVRGPDGFDFTEKDSVVAGRMALDGLALELSQSGVKPG